MTYEIPSNYVLPPGRVLVEVGGVECIGTIVNIGEDKGWACFPDVFRYSVPDNTKIRRTTIGEPGGGEPPERPETFIVDYSEIIFNSNNALEVTIDETDYVMIHVNDIMGLIPPE